MRINVHEIIRDASLVEDYFCYYVKIQGPDV